MGVNSFPQPPKIKLGHSVFFTEVAEAGNRADRANGQRDAGVLLIDIADIGKPPGRLRHPGGVIDRGDQFYLLAFAGDRVTPPISPTAPG